VPLIPQFFKQILSSNIDVVSCSTHHAVRTKDHLVLTGQLVFHSDKIYFSWDFILSQLIRATAEPQAWQAGSLMYS